VSAWEPRGVFSTSLLTLSPHVGTGTSSTRIGGGFVKSKVQAFTEYPKEEIRFVHLKYLIRHKEFAS
jgi:hypothetical protein